MKEFLEKIFKRELKTTKDRINRTQATIIKNELLQAIQEELGNVIDVTRVKDGLALEIPHDELGSIVFILDVKNKSLDYDIETEKECFIQEMKDKEDKAKEKAKAKKLAAKK